MKTSEARAYVGLPVVNVWYKIIKLEEINTALLVMGFLINIGLQR